MKTCVLILASLLCSCHHSVNKASDEFRQAKISVNNVPLSQDSIFSIIADLGICAKVSEKEWATMENDYVARKNYYYWCDSNYFKVYPLLKNSASLFILEVSVNHSSGEYHNFVVQNTKNKYEVIQFFQGYIDSTYPGKDSIYDVACTFRADMDARALCLGRWNKNGIYNDSLLGFWGIDSLSETWRIDSFTTDGELKKQFNRKFKWS